MTWTYRQQTGALLHDDAVVATGYSGAGPGKNNPADEAIPNVGPIPRGAYIIGTPKDSPHMGPEALPLTPDGHDALGRSGFFMHGDNEAHTASTGCIIMPRQVRDQVAASPDRALEVVAA
jgi:hypothetical protein